MSKSPTSRATRVADQNPDGKLLKFLPEKIKGPACFNFVTVTDVKNDGGPQKLPVSYVTALDQEAL